MRVCVCVSDSAIGSGLVAAEGATVIDARGKLVVPGSSLINYSPRNLICHTNTHTHT